MNIYDIQKKKSEKIKISMITCYDYSFARILNQSPVDMILVGDSLAMVMHGYDNTIQADLNMMRLHTQAVAKGAPDKFLVSDMPFLANRKGLSENMGNVEVLMRSGAHAVKIEGARGNTDLIKHIVESGVPVMGHLGLTPQSLHQLGGFKLQGKEKHQGEQIFANAVALQEAGCFSLVLECVPSSLAQKISQELKIPCIGIGAGVYVDGQVLVLQDLLGMNSQFSPKFVRHFFSGEAVFGKVFADYHQAVLDESFPNIKESW